MQDEDLKQRYAAIGFLGAHIQIYRGLGEEKWSIYKEEFLGEVDKELGGDARQIYQGLFDEVENYEKHIHSEICKSPMNVDSEIYKRSKFEYKIPKILQISKRIQECERAVDALSQQMEKNPAENSRRIQELEVEIALYGLMRESFMDEGIQPGSLFGYLQKRRRSS